VHKILTYHQLDIPSEFYGINHQELLEGKTWTIYLRLGTGDHLIVVLKRNNCRTYLQYLKYWIWAGKIIDHSVYDSFFT
jgi:hypothetical protein